MLVLKFYEGIRKEGLPSSDTSAFIWITFGYYTGAWIPVLLGGWAVACWVWLGITIRLGCIKMDFKLVSLKISQAVKDCNIVFSVVIVNFIFLQFCRVFSVYVPVLRCFHSVVFWKQWKPEISSGNICENYKTRNNICLH